VRNDRLTWPHQRLLTAPVCFPCHSFLHVSTFYTHYEQKNTKLTTSTMSTSENGSANGSAHLSDYEPQAWEPPRRNVLNDAANLINRGGLGHAAHNPAPQPPAQPNDILAALDRYDKQFLPHQSKSLSGIALRSFLLGTVLALSLTLALLLLHAHNPLWRAPFFLTTLSIFHFLEFWTTAYANSASATISSFLLSSNGSAYNIAHSASFLETLLSHMFLPSILPPLPRKLLLFVGLALIAIGQATRALAMLTAGTNFSHVVRHTKASSHQLVTTGVYSILRHPSYFGFFWWGIGTQLMCGNTICLLGYAVVLWRFFDRRIKGEEELLVRFFGNEYVVYRRRTRVGIPGIK
jgi:protein-S-isoprenylcysteine O-methyltransferase